MPLINTLLKKNKILGIRRQISYAVASNVASAVEGTAVTFTITTKWLKSGSVLYYTLSGTGITSSDISGGVMSNSITVNNNTATVVVTPSDDGVYNEGTETLVFNLRTGSTSGPTVATVSVDIVDTPAPLTLTVQYEVIAGGGSGGQGGYPSSTVQVGGGGGAGGFLSGTATKTLGIAYNISVGGGGASNPSLGASFTDSSGTNSYFDTHTATGGGYGGRYRARSGDGGSSGGSSNGTLGTAVSGQGNQGRNWPQPGYSGSGSESGGGGGAGGRPPDGIPLSPNGIDAVMDGGPGRVSSLTGFTFGGGGAGGTAISIGGATRRYGGGGGGGNGGYGGGSSGQDTRAGLPGGTNTGGGGGGGAWGNSSPNPLYGYGGSGGSGVIYFKIPVSFSAVFSAGITGGPVGSPSGGLQLYGVYGGTGTVTFAVT